MASIARKHLSAHAHPHFRRVKSNAKPENVLIHASAEKPNLQENKQNISKINQKAKINRKGFEGNAKRTNIPNQIRSINNWRRLFKEDKFFRYRVISRRYLRKLSLQPNRAPCQPQRRKISWGNEVEILVFDSQQ